MSPFVVTLRTELRRASRDGAMAGLAVVFTLIALYAAWNGNAWARDRQAALDSVARQEEAEREIGITRFRTAAMRNPAASIDAAGVAGGLWNRPAMPLRPLALAALGQADGYRYDAKFHATTPAHRIFERAGADLSNPAAGPAGPFDLAFVVVFILPLLLFATSHDLWVQEREAGTSVMVLSQPTTFGPILAAKALARGGTLLLFATLVVEAVLLGLAPGRVPILEHVAAAAFVMLYGVFWLLVTVQVNLVVKRSATAAIACVTLWLSLVVLGPALSATALDVARPAASQAEHVNALRLRDLELDQRQPAPAATAASGGTQRSERLRRAVADAERRDDELMPLQQRYEETASLRRQMSDALRFLSPAVIAEDAFERLAGTDADRALAFERQALAFLRELRAFVAQDRSAEPESLDPAIARIPRFHFDETLVGNRTALGADFVALLAWLALPGGSVLLVLRRRSRSFASHFSEVC